MTDDMRGFLTLVGCAMTAVYCSVFTPSCSGGDTERGGEVIRYEAGMLHVRAAQPVEIQAIITEPEPPGITYEVRHYKQAWVVHFRGERFILHGLPTPVRVLVIRDDGTADDLCPQDDPAHRWLPCL